MRSLTCLVAAGLVALVAAPVSAQSLAEVAKKLEDQRKDVKTPAKVYGNKDLKEVPPPAAAPQSDAVVPADATATPPTPPETPAAEPVPAVETKDRAYWSKRIQKAREQLDHDRVLAEALQARVNALNSDVVNRDDPAQRARLLNDRDQALTELDRQKQAVMAGHKAISDIEEEARRAGAPPGWLR